MAALRNAALLALAAMLWCGGASATPSCQGTYAATSMQPPPERVVVDLDISDRSKRNLMLADRTQTALSMAPAEKGVRKELLAWQHRMVRADNQGRTGSSGAINTERSSQCPVVSGL